MRKIFTFFAALLIVGTAANATEPKIINPGTNTLHAALYTANDGDVIVLKDGTYDETPSYTGGYLLLNHNVTIMAEEGAHPVINIRVPAQIYGGKKVTIKGIKWDATDFQADATWYEHVIYASDATSGNELVLEDCEFCNHHYHKWENSVDKGLRGNSTIYCENGKKLDKVTISNCYFHDITGGCMKFENTDMAELTITNSSFAVIDSTHNYYAGAIQTNTSSGKVEIDHCTFYGCQTNDPSHNVVEVLTTTDALVSNSIFMAAAGFNCCATQIKEGGTIKNCLTYQYTNWQGDGNHKGHMYNSETTYKPTITNCEKADPMFLDVANKNFTPGSTSPALTMSTSGGCIGDSRWHPTSITPTYAKTTYVAPKDLDFSYTDGLVAYRAESANSTGVRMESVTKVPKGTPLLLIGTAATEYKVAGAARIAAPENLLKAGDGSTEFTSATFDYILYSDGLFYRVTSGTVAEDKAYLHLDSAPSGAAGLRIIFDTDNATDIQSIEDNDNVVKFFQNGQLLILRDGITYDALGRIVK